MTNSRKKSRKKTPKRECGLSLIFTTHLSRFHKSFHINCERVMDVCAAQKLSLASVRGFPPPPNIPPVCMCAYYSLYIFLLSLWRLCYSVKTILDFGFCEGRTYRLIRVMFASKIFLNTTGHTGPFYYSRRCEMIKNRVGDFPDAI